MCSAKQVVKSAVHQGKDIFEGMTDPFFDILLESWVIVDNTRKIHSGFLVINDNSRLEQNIEKKDLSCPRKCPCLDAQRFLLLA